MGVAKSGGQGERIGEVFMECDKKKEFSGFWIFPAGCQLRLAGAKTAPGGKTASRRIKRWRLGVH